MGMHPGQLTVSLPAVRRLVAEQFPAWAGLEVVPVDASGTVNAIFRLGDRLAARFPLHPGHAQSVRRMLEAEAEAARELLGRTPVPTPEPVAIGNPGGGYPLPWSVQTWLPGVTAVEADPSASVAFARDLAAFIRAVRSLGVRGRSFSGAGRGGDLRDHDRWMETCLANSAGLVDVPRLRALWADLRELPRASPDVMTHGDLIPGNVLVAGGRLTGVLDVGGSGPADPALDLVAAWHLLEERPRQVLRRGLGCGDLEWARGTAWALEQAMGAVWYYRETNPVMHRMGLCTLARILSQPTP